MAKFVIKTPVVTVNSVVLSDHVSQATVESQFDDVDVTAFGSAYREKLQGLGDATITLSFFQDYAAGSVDATLWPLHSAGTSFVVKVKATNAATSATNPEYTMTGVLFTYNPVDGAIGDAAATDVTIINASQAGLTRATS